MTIEDKLQQLRVEYKIADEGRRKFILRQVESLKRAQAWFDKKGQETISLDKVVDEAKEIFKLPT